MRLRLYPSRHLQELDRSERMQALPDDHGGGIEIREVITHIVNDARTGEFDDSPIM